MTAPRASRCQLGAGDRRSARGTGLLGVHGLGVGVPVEVVVRPDRLLDGREPGRSPLAAVVARDPARISGRGFPRLDVPSLALPERLWHVSTSSKRRRSVSLAGPAGGGMAPYEPSTWATRCTRTGPCCNSDAHRHAPWATAPELA